MIDRAKLLKDLQGLLPHIEKDILAYSEANAELSEHLTNEYTSAVEAERTAEHFVSWREAQITQAAVSWVLTCVFVRFLEDNGLLTEPVLAGPVSDAQGTNALQQAKERMVAYFNENPTFEERHYLLDLFAELEQYPVIAELLDRRHNPLWQIPVSADGAKQLIDFFQKIDPETGDTAHDFTDNEWDTRFLGDLYQDLSESVRKRYALLQTPEFVEEFILDYTLTPAIETFGLPGLRLIDPTCGSGHFLLTTFKRVFNLWQKREPGTNSRALAQRALDVVHGTDINPYAIAICRFRLLIAAMQAAGSSKIKDAPDFQFNLACGDSLLHGRRFEWEGQGNQQDMLDETRHVYEVEDADKLNKILGQRYHVVVGNPPYITVKDKALSHAYRDKYVTCHRQYSLGVPFTERFFDLAQHAQDNLPAGFMGMITANSFMKREFGKKLIEQYLPRKDLTHVVDTSGAYIPGHGTPTLIMFARNQAPRSRTIKAVQGIRGEPSTPDIAAKGKVWSSIVSLLPQAQAENNFISVTEQPRETYGCHPWSLSGGGATDLKKFLDSVTEKTLGKCVTVIGRYTHTGSDEAYFLPVNRGRLLGFTNDQVKPLVEGDVVRDWTIRTETEAVFPYGRDLQAIEYDNANPVIRHLWKFKQLLRSRREPSGTHEEIGLTWYEWSRWHPERFSIPLGVAFAEVSTHNHFVLDRGGNVFKQTAPVIKLNPTATELDYFAILGVLNSSVACFWIKQVFHNKGDSTDSQGARVTGDPAFDTYQIASTGLRRFPLVVDDSAYVVSISKEIDLFARQLLLVSPKSSFMVADEDVKALMRRNKASELGKLQRMVSLQEELDWHIYRLYGLIDTDLCFAGDLPLINPGERAFEIALARRMLDGEIESSWFSRHDITPITDIPSHWPQDYRQLIEQRLQLMQSNPWVKLVEQPEYKRRWHRDSWDERVKAAAKAWLLDQIEAVARHPVLLTCAQLADKLRSDTKVLQVAELYCGSNMLDLQALVSELVAGDQVPQMAAARLKPAAMKKWFAWQQTWDKQRQEDAIDARHGVDKPLDESDAQDSEKQAAYALAKQKAELEKQRVVGPISVPPAYKQSDFRQASFWKLRGKLDVPKERFFSLPGCEKGGDSTLVVGWAGLNHLQRAQAIAAWYLDRKEGEGWEADRLMPMLVALDELIPWLKQWHNEVDPEFGERMGDYYEGFLLEELRSLEIMRDDLLSWQPPAVAASRGGRKKKAADKN